MPLRLDRHRISRYSGRALHRQLADVIRSEIREGDLRPGEALPSEASIASTVGLSVTSVRDAMSILVNEGLIIKRSGSPSRVAETPAVRHLASSRYAEELALLRSGEKHPLTSAFSREHNVDLSEVTLDLDYSEDVATPTDAELLDIKEGTPILRRQFVKRVRDEPVQLQRSAIPMDLVRDTPVSDPSQQPWPGGTVAELFSIGLVVTKVIEDAGARVPTDDERTLLDLASGGPVLDVVRVFEVDDRPVEASRVVVPAARYRLRYETVLT